MIAKFRKALADFAGGTEPVPGAWGAGGLATTCSRGAAAVAVACEFPSFCPSGNEPQFSQNFAPTGRAAPQFLQKVGTAMADESTRCALQIVQNACPSEIDDPHWNHEMLMVS